MIKSSWDDISADSICNCFRHAGFREDIQPISTDYVQGISSDVQNIWDILRDNGFIPNEVTFNDYVGADNNLLVPSTHDIIEQLLAPDSDDSSDDDNSTDVLPVPTIHDGLRMVIDLRRLLETMNEGPNTADFQALSHIADIL